MCSLRDWLARDDDRCGLEFVSFQGNTSRAVLCLLWFLGIARRDTDRPTQRESVREERYSTATELVKEHGSTVLFREH